VWKGGFITCGVFAQFITVFTSAILTETTYGNMLAAEERFNLFLVIRRSSLLLRMYSVTRRC